MFSYTPMTELLDLPIERFRKLYSAIGRVLKRRKEAAESK